MEVGLYFLLSLTKFVLHVRFFLSFWTIYFNGVGVWAYYLKFHFATFKNLPRLLLNNVLLRENKTLGSLLTLMEF